MVLNRLAKKSQKSSYRQGKIKKIKKTVDLDVCSIVKPIPDPDVRVIVHGRATFLHKKVLISRSNAFDRLLNENRVTSIDLYIDNMSVMVFRLVVHYMYRGVIPYFNDLRLCMDLYVAAVVYQMPGLVRICHQLIKKIICKNNVLGIFYKALEYHDNEMKLIVREYCKNNNKIVSNSIFELMKKAEDLLLQQLDEIKQATEKKKEEEELLKKKETENKKKKKKK